MTDISLYFIHENKGVLLDYQNSIQNYIDCEPADILTNLKYLTKQGIKVYNNEVDKIPDNLIVIKEHVYRF
jgi:hypothetical protein